MSGFKRKCITTQIQHVVKSAGSDVDMKRTIMQAVVANLTKLTKIKPKDIFFLSQYFFILFEVTKRLCHTLFSLIFVNYINLDTATKNIR